MACDEYNRWMRRFCYLPLQVEAVDVWQFDIEDEAGRYIRLVRALVVAGGTECDGPHIVRRQQLAECLPNTFIVVHNEDDTIIRHHDAAFDSTGNVKMNFTPCGSFLSAHRRPPCNRSEEHPSALQSLMRISYAVFCLK